MANVLITGATSGIGKSLVELYVKEGYFVIATGRNLEKIKELSKYENCVVTYLDVISENCEEVLYDLSRRYDLDIIILNAGTGFVNKNLDSEKEFKAIDVNVVGFTKCLLASYKFFEEKGKGILVGISSVAGIRGLRYAPAYSASKSYIMTYLEGLRHKSSKEKNGIHVLDIRPGFVRTPLILNGESKKYSFGSISSEKAAKLIYKSIKRCKKVTYIPWWWSIISMVIKFLPRKIFYRI